MASKTICLSVREGIIKNSFQSFQMKCYNIFFATIFNDIIYTANLQEKIFHFENFIAIYIPI